MERAERQHLNKMKLQLHKDAKVGRAARRTLDLPNAMARTLWPMKRSVLARTQANPPKQADPHTRWSRARTCVQAQMKREAAEHQAASHSGDGHDRHQRQQSLQPLSPQQVRVRDQAFTFGREGMGGGEVERPVFHPCRRYSWVGRHGPQQLTADEQPLLATSACAITCVAAGDGAA